MLHHFNRVDNSDLGFLNLPHGKASEQVIDAENILGGYSSVLETIRMGQNVFLLSSKYFF
jgi:hypothetical protein